MVLLVFGCYLYSDEESTFICYLYIGQRLPKIGVVLSGSHLLNFQMRHEPFLKEGFKALILKADKSSRTRLPF